MVVVVVVFGLVLGGRTHIQDKGLAVAQLRVKNLQQEIVHQRMQEVIPGESKKQVLKGAQNVEACSKVAKEMRGTYYAVRNKVQVQDLFIHRGVVEVEHHDEELDHLQPNRAQSFGASFNGLWNGRE